MILFMVGSWIWMGQYCSCPSNLYLLRGIVLWMTADTWEQLVSLHQSIYPQPSHNTWWGLQLFGFLVQRLQRSAAVIQAIVITHGAINPLDRVVFGTCILKDILDVCFQAQLLYSHRIKRIDRCNLEKLATLVDIESNHLPHRQPGCDEVLESKDPTKTSCFPKPFTEAPPELDDLLALPEFDKTTQWELSAVDFQRLTQTRLKMIAQTRVFQLSLLPGMGKGGKTDPGGCRQLLEGFHWLGQYDLSLFDVVGVHCIGGNVVFIHGSEEQLSENRDRIDAMDDVYCFGATELSHGSNVKQIQTTAEYDPKTDEFVLTTPSVTACKYWIGNSTFVADYAVVLARLLVKGEERSISWLRVPLWKSKESNEHFPGVTIRDIGVKAGCNGIGNGCITFDHVRVPRSALMSQFCEVDEAGDFQSALSSSDLFLRCMQTFVLERVGVAACAIGAAKTAIYVALRYAAVRHQFGPDGDEVPLISYPMHQRRIMSHAVRLFVGKATVDRISRIGQETFHPYKFGDDRKKLHALSCLVKAFGTWESFAAAQEARELCGGNSYAATSQIGMSRNDLDVTLTFGGDNSILALEVARHRLKEIKEWSTVKKLLGPTKPTTRSIFIADQQNPTTAMDKCLKLLVYREESMLLSVGKKLFADKDKGFRGFTENSFEMREVAAAVYDRMCVETWLEEQMDQGQLYCEIGLLDALQRVQKHASWYFAKGAMNAPTHEAIEGIITNTSGILGRKHERVLEALYVPQNLVKDCPLVQSDYSQAIYDLTYPTCGTGKPLGKNPLTVSA
ncbi:Acyl-coenzyme A oxidase [Seminavis robusta]|uniref:Acyl-coenzyme A oxidase n=1 Tax=Seminavis robusta TaxID=568900 RepID=A0A9N8F411_9STRA|nr:Acyl-coenzyme A oxidase [Seminavis robusta]|eukprot:Sro3346_g347040.1 Acyl-coenzyme A oxidase (789) ;mRNA; f:2796-5231